MRDTEHFKNHLWLVTQTGDEPRKSVPIEDPFHTTRIEVELVWSFWDWLKMIFNRRERVKVLVKVQSDGCSQGRWFQGADICENCLRSRLTGHSTKPGYESHGMRVCEDCYYERPIKTETVGQCGPAT